MREVLAVRGNSVTESTVAMCGIKRPSPEKGLSWKAFLRNEIGEIAAGDSFVVPSARFRVLDCFVVM